MKLDNKCVFLGISHKDGILASEKMYFVYVLDSLRYQYWMVHVVLFDINAFKASYRFAAGSHDLAITNLSPYWKINLIAILLSHIFLDSSIGQAAADSICPP